jgi:hypothetical protein
MQILTTISGRRHKKTRRSAAEWWSGSQSDGENNKIKTAWLLAEM